MTLENRVIVRGLQTKIISNRLRRHRTMFLFCIVAVLILFSPRPGIAQDEEFPIGLYLVYNDKWSSGGIGIYENSDTIRYDFLRWVDESTDLVEISKDSEILQVRYPSVTHYIEVNVPLWIDTGWSDTWTNGMNISLGGLTLEVSRTTRNVEAGSFASWYLSTQTGFRLEVVIIIILCFRRMKNR
jgi:hypothetical protein